MRFLAYHKVDAKMEAAAPPDPKLVHEMTTFVQDSLQQGVFVDGAGLHRSATRVRLSLKGGERTITRGPYAGSNENLSAFVQLKAKDLDEAIVWATKLGEAAGDGELEIGPVVEPWDLGMFPKPSEDLPVRYLVLLKATEESERGTRRRPRLERVLEELDRAGKLLGVHELLPSRQGKRYRTFAGKKGWTDGPFAESKELVAGFGMLELEGWDDVVRFTERYAEILGDTEVDVRVVDDGSHDIV